MPNSVSSKGNGFTIEVAQSGFYQGFNRVVAVTPKVCILLLIAWAVWKPSQAQQTLELLQNWTTDFFGAWYIYTAAAFMLCTIGLAILPKTGKVKLGSSEDRPEFSNFSWFAMMFGAGMGISMLTYSTAEPIFHFVNSPEAIQGLTQAEGSDNVRAAYKWAFFHYALTPWSMYAIIGITLAYLSYTHKMPMTIRSALVPLFGKSISGPLGHLVDVVAILATVIGVGVTIGYGVSQFASGMHNISGAAWMVDDTGKPTFTAQISCLFIVLLASTLSAMSGIARGVKWLSNVNLSLSVVLLVFLIFFGALSFASSAFFHAIWDYLLNLLPMSFTVWSADSSPELASWQGSWTIFYWAWWIAFAPFVGLFLARVSKGRTLREYVLGAVVIPSVTCLCYFALAGGTAINLELSGVAQGSIINADISAQLFKTINLIASPEVAVAISIVVVILLLTYLVTSVDSAILVVTTLASAGNREQKHTKHIVIWALILSAVVASLLAVGGMPALRSAMIVGALPFSLVMVLMLISLIKVLFSKKNLFTQ